MFCPSAVDYGNVADWISGGASSFAGIVALVVAFKDNGSRAEEKKAAAVKDAESENAILAQVLNMYRNSATVSQELLSAYESGGPISNGDWVAELRRNRDAAIRYQSMPQTNLRAYLELEKIVTMGSLPDDLKFMDPADIEHLLKGVIYQCEYMKNAIISSPNPLSPLNW